MSPWELFITGRERMRTLVQETVTEKPVAEPEDGNERRLWYRVSYPEIVALFRETCGVAVEHWVRRVAAIYSWLPRIPTWQYDREVVRRYIDFEISVNGLHIEYLEAVLPTNGKGGEIRENYHPQRQIGGKDGTPNIDVLKALSLANTALHGEGSKNDHVSSSSKLLHFSLPGLFPILDRNICRMLFGSENPTAKHYHAYVCLIHDQLAQRSPFDLLEGHTDLLEKAGNTPVRVFEDFLFRWSDRTGGI